VRQRVARSRELVAHGRPAAVVARVVGISRQAIYRRSTRPAGQRRPLDDVDRAVLGVARANPTDGSGMVAAICAGEIGEAVSQVQVVYPHRSGRPACRRSVIRRGHPCRTPGRRRLLRSGATGAERSNLDRAAAERGLVQPLADHHGAHDGEYVAGRA
jgi:hypothetical protein